MPIKFGLNVFARQRAFVFTSGVSASSPDTQPCCHPTQPEPPSCKLIYFERQYAGSTSSCYCSFCGLTLFYGLGIFGSGGAVVVGAFCYSIKFTKRSHTRALVSSRAGVFFLFQQSFICFPSVDVDSRDYNGRVGM